MEHHRYNPDYRRSNQNRDVNNQNAANSYDDDYYEPYRNESRPSFASHNDREHDWWNHRSGQHYGGRGAEDFTRHGYVNQNTHDFGRPDNYLYPEDHRRQFERTGDLWPESTSSRDPRATHPNDHQRALQGNHRGKGPRNYTRSDERITEDLNDRLYDDAFVDASGIEVSVTNGDVLLTGSIDSREAKRRAEDICEGVSGVRNVENRLRIEYAENAHSDFGDNNETTRNTSRKM